MVCELCDSLRSQCTLSPRVGEPSRDPALLEDPEHEDSSLSPSPTALTPEALVVEDDDDEEEEDEDDAVHSLEVTDGLDTAFNNLADSFNCFKVSGGTLVPS